MSTVCESCLLYTSGDRAELAVEMLTELGIDEIVPWQAERSVVRWAPERVERGPVSYTHLDVYKRQDLIWLLTIISCTSLGLMPGNARGMMRAGVRRVVIRSTLAWIVARTQSTSVTHLGYPRFGFFFEIASKTSSVSPSLSRCSWIS